MPGLRDLPPPLGFAGTAAAGAPTGAAGAVAGGHGRPQGSPGDGEKIWMNYPLVMTNIAIENGHL